MEARISYRITETRYTIKLTERQAYLVLSAVEKMERLTDNDEGLIVDVERQLNNCLPAFKARG